MTILPLLHTTFALILSQTSIDTSKCNVFWLDRVTFDTVVSVELAETPQMQNSISASVICRKLQATIIISSPLAAPDCPPFKRVISLYDTPEETRTRTLALTVSDALNDFAGGVSRCRWAPPIAAPSSPASNRSSTQFSPSGLQKPQSSNDHLATYRHTTHNQLEISGLSAFSHPHFAPSLQWRLAVKSWRWGLWAAGMRFHRDTGKVYSGAGALRLGYAVYSFLTQNSHLGELSLNLLAGVVHGRGSAVAPARDEHHTQPLAAVEADFTWLRNPNQRNTLGIRIFSGWMMGMTLRANNEKIGGFNGFYAGAGIVVMLRSSK